MSLTFCNLTYEYYVVGNSGRQIEQKQKDTEITNEGRKEFDVVEKTNRKKMREREFVSNYLSTNVKVCKTPFPPLSLFSLIISTQKEGSLQRGVFHL